MPHHYIRPYATFLDLISIQWITGRKMNFVKYIKIINKKFLTS